MNEKKPAAGEKSTYRIAHFLARCGVAARRKAEELVSAGKVTVNGQVVTELGRQIDPARDVVVCEGKSLNLNTGHLTLAINKPMQVVVTRSDPQGRRTIYDLLPIEFAGRAGELVYCGRLDYETEGLIILTTDGELANRMMHPSHHVAREYEAALDRPLSETEIKKLADGVELDDGPTQPCTVRPAGKSRKGFLYRIIIREGRNRQVRRMIATTGAKVERLARTRVGRLDMKDLALKSGECLELSPAQVAKLI